jgi:hypothetical protein
MSPDIRKHRGAHPEDRKLFADDQLPILRTAAGELSWLLTRDYAMKGAVKLVGDRHGLNDRQRLAVSRAACSDQSKETRSQTQLAIEDCKGKELIIDGFNLVITIEAALSGGVLILGVDGCIRDLSSVHGSYRSVDETARAIELIGESLETLQPKSVSWLLDRPVSNSGRLATRIRNLQPDRGWVWDVTTTFNPDAEIISSGKVAVTSDGPLLDRVKHWMNFNRYLLEERLRNFWLIDLSG